MFNLLLNYMSKEYGRLIGNTIGRVRAVDVQPDGSGWGKFLRVQIEMDLRKTIARGRTISVENSKLWIPLK